MDLVRLGEIVTYAFSIVHYSCFKFNAILFYTFGILITRHTSLSLLTFTLARVGLLASVREVAS